MPGFAQFRPYRGQLEDEHLEARLKAIEHALLDQTPAPPVDTSQLYLPAPLPGIGGGGGGGGSPPPAPGAVGVYANGVVVISAAAVLNFQPGIDVTNLIAGNQADLTLDLAAAVTGDVAYTLNAGQVQAILGKLVEAPVDGDFLYYDLASGHLKWGTPAGTASGKGVGGQWIRTDVSAAGTSYAEMNMAGGTTGIKAGLPLVGSGTILGVSVNTENILAGGGSYAVQVYQDNGGGLTATGIIATQATGAQQARASGAVAFADGDVLALFDERTGSLTGSNGATAFVFLKFD